jgi:hypothetical protein
MLCAAAGIWSRIGSTRIGVPSSVQGVFALAVVLFSFCPRGFAVQSDAPPPTVGQTNSQDILGAYLQLQEDLRATQRAIEQNRQEARSAATQTAESLSRGLQGMQEAFATQRTRDLEAMQRSNKVMLLLAGALAAMGCLTMLMLTWLQWRMSKDLGAISAALPVALGPEHGPALGALGPAASSGPRLPAALTQPAPHGPDPAPQPAFRTYRPTGRSIERWLFPKATDTFRRRQFRALKTAVAVGLVVAMMVAAMIWLAYAQKGSP